MLNRLSLSVSGCIRTKSNLRIQRSFGKSTKIGSLSIPLDDNNLVRKKINELVLWYEQVTGMDEVRLMQNRVIEAQDRFVLAQENRRKLASELISVQNKLKEIQAELNTTKRGEERYLHLVTEEHKILNEEKRISSEFSITERDERESFSALSSWLKESHEKERAQAERTKYWSIIASMVGTTLGIIGTTINNKLKMRELRNLVLSQNVQVAESIANSSKLQTDNYLINSPGNKEFTSLLSDIREALQKNSANYLHQISTGGSKQQEVIDYIGRINHELQELKHTLSSAQKLDGQVVFMPPDLEYNLDRQMKEIRNIVYGACLVAVISHILFNLILK